MKGRRRAGSRLWGGTSILMGRWPCWYAGNTGESRICGDEHGRGGGVGEQRGSGARREGTRRGQCGTRRGRRGMEVCEDSWRAKGVAPQMGICELSPTLAGTNSALPRWHPVKTEYKTMQRRGQWQQPSCVSPPCRTPLQHHHHTPPFPVSSCRSNSICSTYNPPRVVNPTAWTALIRPARGRSFDRHIRASTPQLLDANPVNLCQPLLPLRQTRPLQSEQPRARFPPNITAAASSTITPAWLQTCSRRDPCLV